MTTAPVHVVAGILRDDAGRVLIARRPPGKHLGGLWEFPGGKLEPGESRHAALARELHEEVGVHLHAARPLIAVPHAYAAKRIVLDVWEVTDWSGTPRSCEGQALAWAAIGDLAQVSMPAADRPVIAALRLPHQYLITPSVATDRDDELVSSVGRALASGVRMVQLRQPDWPREHLAAVARTLRDLCARHDAQLLLGHDWQLAGVLGLDGVHLPARVAASLERRPLPDTRWVGVSCHDPAEIAHALRIGADFVTVSPVRTSASHPDQVGIGWSAFADLVRDCPLPAFALGGLDPTDLDAAREAGAQGIAAIRGLWPDGPAFA